jgi:hypothetical protein
MTLRKPEDARKYDIALCGELEFEEAMDLS